MVLLLVVLKDGKAIETATAGREDVVGAMAGLGLYESLMTRHALEHWTARNGNKSRNHFSK
jgi:hypothetical protein